MRIAVIGIGKLGLCTALCLADASYPVVGMDNRPEYIAGLKAGQIPFYEKDLEDYFEKNSADMLFTDNMEEAVGQSDAAFVIVPTPSGPDGAFSNQYILDVLEEAAPILAKRSRPYLINIVSTVMPGTCENLFLPLLQEKTGKQIGSQIGLTYNPEFIAIGSVIHDFVHPDVVLIGASDERSGATLEAIYRRTCANDPHMARTSLVNAEIAKLSINCYCTMKISFANNLGDICRRMDGADARQVCEIIGHDTRIGGKYIKPGLGFGGPCFPRDNEAFIHFVQGVGGTPQLQQAVVGINDRQVDLAVDRIEDAARQYGPTVALLGMAYKPDTYLTERSQSVDIARRLARKDPHLELRLYDPLAAVDGAWVCSETLESCVAGAHVAALLTPWSAFRETDFTQWMAANHCVVNFWE